MSGIEAGARSFSWIDVFKIRVLSEIIMAWQVTQELELHIKGISFSMNIVFYHLLGIGFHFEQNESTA